MNTVLFGNGFNLLNGSDSWGKIVRTISEENNEGKIPNTLQYEDLIVKEPYQTDLYLITENGDHITTDDGDRIIIGSEKTERLLLRERIVNGMKDYSSNESFDHLMQLNVENYLTTNYDHVAEKVLKSLGFSEKEPIVVKEDSIKQNLQRHHIYVKENRNEAVWHIHGETTDVNSIILGMDQYCKYVSIIDDYLQGKIDNVPNMEERLKNISTMQILSWIDLFFVSDVYIIGFGLEYAEMDLWYVLLRRKRMLRSYGNGLISNNIYFFNNVPSGKGRLLQDLDVIVMSDISSDYSSRYQHYIDCIAEKCL